MTEDERKALASLRLSWSATQDDVWQQPSALHVADLHERVAAATMAGFADAEHSRAASPLGVVIQGHAGTGKTHLLGWIREQVQRQGGYFFLIGLLDAAGFWRTTQVSMLDSLARPAVDGDTQLHQLLRSLASEVQVPRAVKRAVAGETRLDRSALDQFIGALRRYDRQVGQDCQHTLRALVLSAADDLATQQIGESYLHSLAEEKAGEREPWGLRAGAVSDQEIVRHLSRLLALTGPSLIAIDQLDTLLAQSHRSTAGDGGHDGVLLEQIAHGLMALRETTRRTVSVVTCLPSTWELIRDQATKTVGDRFRPVAIAGIPDPAVGQALIEKHVAVRYAEIGFQPAYPSWPVHPSAFADATAYTPRHLLRRIDEHVQHCLAADEVTELRSLTGSVPPPARPAAVAGELAALDARFTELCASADTAAALDGGTEDAAMPPLLAAGLTAWMVESGDPAYEQDPPPSAKPGLHARLRRTLDEATEDQEHWAFRAIAADHGNAVLRRLRAACTEAGLTAGVTKRRLFLLRNKGWSQGAVTQRAVAEFEAAGGRKLGIGADELAVLAALRAMQAEAPAGLAAWLAARQPAHGLAVLREALGTAAPTRQAGPSVAPIAARKGPASGEGVVPLGVTANGEPVAVDLEALRKHTAIFAGSGSGKTVLIRRLIEECALRGVSTIVLDPNNDLARLGTAWPHEPPQWMDGDAAKAADYLAGTEVVVWTPRRTGGRPLSFQPLPDFAGVLDDPDEFNEAIDAAVAALAPRAGLQAGTTKAQVGRAVLREALVYFGRKGRSRLKGFIDLLADFPADVSEIDGAEKIAAGLAQILTAATVNDPLFGGTGTPVDPGLLLTPSAGKRARVSVVSLIGLPSDDQRQSFVNQLQMALFAWVKRNPAGDRPLGGLFVMDEAQTLAPSGGMTACTQSTLALAAQARKYGLGLVFATQAPKGLHNRISGNAATQFFGLLNSPIQIAAAKEMAQAKGSAVPDISRLGSGQFYAAVEGTEFRKIQTPLCLTYHPRSPLTSEEVMELARHVTAGAAPPPPPRGRRPD